MIKSKLYDRRGSIAPGLYSRDYTGMKMADFYEKELSALRRSGRYRSRHIYDDSLLDLASNDYLGLAEHGGVLHRALEDMKKLEIHSPKSSMLVNGYHPVHKEFEEALCRANGYEAGIVGGSGFVSNIALIEALVRRRDTLILDESYHASGQLAAKLTEGEVKTFSHNDAQSLQAAIERRKNGGRIIVAVEGIYSMEGDILGRDIIETADRAGALLILDEAHSSGVLGPNLLGVLDHYGLEVKRNYIKMGTLGKAYGSFGAYILSCGHISEYLLNRAKPLIYATAPSIFDILLSLKAFEYINEEKARLAREIAARQKRVAEIFDMKIDGLIVPIEAGSNRRAVEIRDELARMGIAVGAIRQPTVRSAIVRFIARLGIDEDIFARAAEKIRGVCEK